MIGIRWTFQKRIWGTFIVLSLLSTASKGQVPKLSVSSNQVEIGLNFTVICEVEIISDILFFVNGAKKGDCPNPAFGDPCEPKVIEQNITLGETSWTLTAAIEYEGSWKCNRQGIESSVVDVSMYECPKSVTSQSGIDTSLSLNETATVSITVKIGCIYPTNNPEILLRFISSHSSVVPYITMNCIATAGFCSAGSVFECNQTISRGMEITNGPFDSGINYTLHVDSIVAPSVSTCGRLAVFEPHSLVFETQGPETSSKETSATEQYTSASSILSTAKSYSTAIGSGKDSTPTAPIISTDNQFTSTNASVVPEYKSVLVPLVISISLLIFCLVVISIVVLCEMYRKRHANGHKMPGNERHGDQTHGTNVMERLDVNDTNTNLQSRSKYLYNSEISSNDYSHPKRDVQQQRGRNINNDYIVYNGVDDRGKAFAYYRNTHNEFSRPRQMNIPNEYNLYYGHNRRGVNSSQDPYYSYPNYGFY